MNIPDILQPLLIVAGLAFVASATLFIQTKEAKADKKGKDHDVV